MDPMSDRVSLAR